MEGLVDPSSTPTICMYHIAYLACAMGMIMRFVWIYEHGTVYLIGDYFVGNPQFVPIEHRSLHRFTLS